MALSYLLIAIHFYYIRVIPWVILVSDRLSRVPGPLRYPFTRALILVLYAPVGAAVPQRLWLMGGWNDGR